MKALLIFFCLSALFKAECQNFFLAESNFKPRSLDKISIEGHNYHGDFLRKRIETIATLADIDSTEYYYCLQGFLRDRTDTTTLNEYEELVSTYPEDYLFTDINEDGHEDLIFQSGGPFVFDTPGSIIFLSDKKGESYSTYFTNGRIIDIEKTTITKQYGRKVKGLKITYKEYGCCDLSGWDYVKCKFFFLDKRDHYKKDIELWSVNTNNMEGCSD